MANVDPTAPSYKPGLLDRLLVGLFHTVNKYVAWHKLPKILGAMNLEALRIELRQYNLHDGYSSGEVQGTKSTCPMMDARFKDASVLFDIIMHCLVTIVYRIIPCDESNSHPLRCHVGCIGAARQALSTIVQAGQTLGQHNPVGWNMFLNMSVLQILASQGLSNLNQALFSRPLCVLCGVSREYCGLLIHRGPGATIIYSLCD